MVFPPFLFTTVKNIYSIVKLFYSNNQFINIYNTVFLIIITIGTNLV